MPQWTLRPNVNWLCFGSTSVAVCNTHGRIALPPWIWLGGPLQMVPVLFLGTAALSSLSQHSYIGILVSAAFSKLMGDPKCKADLLHVCACLYERDS